MKLVSFWNILRDENVQIPLFQRDYAQGRHDKETLRRKFVTRLLDALRDPKSKEVKLDFVFGVKDSFSSFQPLDGQQRLTTLWLLHWYVAQRAGKGSAAAPVLSRFSYETRESSTAFCRDLATAEGWNGHDVKSFIKSQRWYFDRYEMDPSVRGFVRTLVTIEQSILKSDNFEKLWSSLSSGDELCPIRFFIRDDLPESVADDLYIKMNSRGKGLTEFENFKADLLGFEAPARDQHRLFSVQDAALVDNAWTDLFWAHQENEEIDDIYFQFFKRFLLSWRIAESGEGGCLPSVSVEAVLNEDLYNHLHWGNEYVGIAIYASTLVPDMVEDLKAFFEAYAALKKRFSEDEIDRIVAPYWLKKDEPVPYTLIPRYGMCGNITAVLDGNILQGLPVLYAASRFLIKNRNKILKIETSSGGMCTEGASSDKKDIQNRFKVWMRFIWNVIDGAFYRDANMMVSGVRFIRVLSDEHTWDIEDFLASLKPEKVGVTFAQKAYVTEIQKARLRAYEQQCRKDNIDAFAWKSEITRAEETAFLHGELGFLLDAVSVESYLHDEKADTFSRQIDNAKRYWDESGIKAKVAVAFCKALIKGVNRFRQTNETYGFLDNDYLCRTGKEDWREVILRDSTMGDAVAYILAQTNLSVVTIRPFADLKQHPDQIGAEKLRKELLSSGVLDQPGIIGPGEQSSWRFHAYKTVAFYRKRGYGKNSANRYYFDTCPMSWVQGCRRNEFLFGGDDIQLWSEDYVDGLNICVPEDQWRTYFIYQGRKYSWGEDNFIWLLNDKWDPVPDHCFWFDYGKIKKRESFLKCLLGL